MQWPNMLMLFLSSLISWYWHFEAILFQPFHYFDHKLSLTSIRWSDSLVGCILAFDAVTMSIDDWWFPKYVILVKLLKYRLMKVMLMQKLCSPWPMKFHCNKSFMLRLWFNWRMVVERDMILAQNLLKNLLSRPSHDLALWVLHLLCNRVQLAWFLLHRVLGSWVSYRQLVVQTSEVQRIWFSDGYGWLILSHNKWKVLLSVDIPLSIQTDSLS